MLELLGCVIVCLSVSSYLWIQLKAGQRQPPAAGSMSMGLFSSAVIPARSTLILARKLWLQTRISQLQIAHVPHCPAHPQPTIAPNQNRLHDSQLPARCS